MKYKIANSNNLVAIAGRIGYISKKFNSLTAVSIASTSKNDETEWSYLSFSNPNNNFNGTKWADYANKNLKVGQFVLTVCYEKQNGEYTNYYVNACNSTNLFYNVPNTNQIAVIGKVVSITKKNDTLYEVVMNCDGANHTILFRDTDKFHCTKFASKLEKNQVLGCVVSKVTNEKGTSLFANAFEYGPKESI